MKIKISILILCLLIWSGRALAATHAAATCSNTNIQTAIDASSTGDTVTVPAGNCTWTGGVGISGKNIILQGAGVASTIITTIYALVITENSSQLTGFRFDYNVDPVVNVSGTGWRIHHCYFNYTGSGTPGAIYADGRNAAVHPTGLMDHNTMINGGVAILGRGTFPDESTEWTVTPTFGTAGNGDSVYVEDNTFTRPNISNMTVVDSNYSGSYVFRYNTVTDMYVEVHSVQSDNNRAGRRWEVYGNLHNTTRGDNSRPYRMRAGTGFIFNNTISGDWNGRLVAFDFDRCYGSYGTAGQCTGSATGGWDGNTSGQSGWLCRDQPGSGADTSVFNPPTTNTQAKLPVYLWSNRDLGLNGSSNLLSVPAVVNSCDTWIQANRDYFTDGASFNGTSGTGCGTLASRPATCTTGVAYWATNQSCTTMTGMVGVNPSTPISGTLYKCTATNTWTSYYTPYTYPHPLAGGLPPVATPTNFGVKVIGTEGT